MIKKIITLLTLALLTLSVSAQSNLKKVYDETSNPNIMIDQALAKAGKEGKFVVCQVGGNWCKWCLMFADFVEKDAEITQTINDNFVLSHINYNPKDKDNKEAQKMLQRLNKPQRFGFPVFVVLDSKGKVLHIQDSSFLEEGNGYDKAKVLRFFKNWTPKAVL